MSKKMTECGHRADVRLGIPPSLPAEIEAAGWVARDSSSAVKEAAERWRICMKPQGVIDLPESPIEMPSASVIGVGIRKDGQGNVLGGAPTASAREREVAVADVRCQTSSGWESTVLRVRAEAELTAIGRDTQGFEAAREKYREYGQRVSAVIAELGG